MASEEAFCMLKMGRNGCVQTFPENRRLFF
jgi:hypothetical protein